LYPSNSVRQPGIFGSTFVLNQLHSGGIFEGLKVRNTGFQGQESFEELVDRYGILSTDG
jgi:myosin heavy subunit